MARKLDDSARLREVFRTIGDNIIRARGHDMSQGDLAKKSGVSRSTIFAIENGEPISLQNLLRIADALGIKPPDLFITDDDRQRVSYLHVKLMDRLAESLDIKKKGEP